jgi:CDP-glycerol glycerophosphotransferase (TagB/SpsB family)
MTHHLSLMNKKVFIIADHGLALIYFLQSDVAITFLQAGVEVIFFTDDEALPEIQKRFEKPGIIFEGIRVKECRNYYQTVKPVFQRWLDLLRWTGGSKRMNSTALDGNFHLITAGYTGYSRLFLPFLRSMVWLMRRSRLLRKAIIKLQNYFTPAIYADLFEKYQPHMVISRTPCWRMDRYILREAAGRNIPTAAVTVGWDNPSSYAMSGAPVNYITCWSEIQKQEYILGSDWDPARVNISGIPAYDGYFRKEWLLPRDEYFRQHGLDPNRKLLSYACSFETLHPNFPNIQAIADLVNGDGLSEPCQLLIRFHPNHFIKDSRFEEERKRTIAYVQDMPHVHVVDPVSLGAGLAHYSGEDMPEKASMMAYSDVFLTVYSTMVVETAIHNRPIISVTIDTPGGWNRKDIYSLPLTAIGDWPTHQRFIQAGAGRVADTPGKVRNLINFYLEDPEADSENRRKFIADECTFTDGSAGRRTGEFLISLLDKSGEELNHVSS